MFRLLASSTGQAFRPVLLRNVCTNSSPLKLSGATNAPVKVEKNFQYRNNATLALAHPVKPETSPTSTSSSYPGFSVDKEEPVIARSKASRFEELLAGAMAKTSVNRGKPLSKQLFDAVHVLAEMFRDDAVQSALSADDVYKYVNVLNEAVYLNRLGRLNETRNRDSDQHRSVSLLNDIWLKNAILDLAENVSSGPLQKLVSGRIVRKLLFAMLQLQVNSEVIKFWEHGVNDPRNSRNYLKHNVLAVVLPLTYMEKRFLYEQVINLYEVNTKGSPYVTHQLSSAIGKVAIQEGDYLRALNCLDLVLVHLDSGKGDPSSVHKTLAELHAAFIGECKDIKIARHFFTSTVEDKLPYKVILKAPHVQKLMEHCVEAGEPYEAILELWKQLLAVYVRDSGKTFNARYSIINKAFLLIFFRFYPALTEEGHTKLREAIAAYASIKPVDDFFLNNVISNCTWNDKTVFEQLVENYAAHNVSETAVSYRVILKKMGEIPDLTTADILHQWNTTLSFLDAAGFTYIPIADWASLRDATILSPHSETRTEFYLAVLNAYKNYHQDDNAVHRFIKYWLSKPEALQIARVSSGPGGVFETDVDVELPQFANLRENVDYDVVAANLIVSTREENDARGEALL